MLEKVRELHRRVKLARMLRKTAEFYRSAEEFGVKHEEIAAELASEMECRIEVVPLWLVTRRVVEKLRLMKEEFVE